MGGTSKHLTETPTAGLTGAPRPRRRPRGSHIAALFATAAIGSVLAGLIWAQHYQPIQPGSGWYGAGRAAEGDQLSLPADKEITNSFGTDYLVTEPKPGDRVGLTIPVYNDGRYPIRIVAVGAPFTPYLVTDVHVFRSRDLTTGGPPFVRFRPFTLKPEQDRGLAVTARLIGCPPGQHLLAPSKDSPYTTAAVSIPITYRFLGMTHTTDLPLAYRLTLRNPPQCA